MTKRANSKATRTKPGPSPERLRLAARLKEARVAANLSMLETARQLRWSLGRLQSYENGTTCPSIEESNAMATLYAVHPVALAFGSAAGDVDVVSGNGVALVQSIGDGRRVSVPQSILDGPPPYRCAVLERSTMGFRAGDVAIFRPGDVRARGLHVVDLDGSPAVLWSKPGGRGDQWLHEVHLAPVTIGRKSVVLGAVVGVMKSVSTDDAKG